MVILVLQKKIHKHKSSIRKPLPERILNSLTYIIEKKLLFFIDYEYYNELLTRDRVMEPIYFLNATFS